MPASLIQYKGTKSGLSFATQSRRWREVACSRSECVRYEFTYIVSIVPCNAARMQILGEVVRGKVGRNWVER